MRINSFILNVFTNIKDHYFGKKLKKRGELKFNKENFYSWMNLTKKDRFNLSKIDSMNYFAERKNLLNKIRNEYKDIIEKN
tara:strand:- start:32 stop:274 length:243 start_codon:yes stop_codon:yes gene_type:complete